MKITSISKAEIALCAHVLCVLLFVLFAVPSCSVRNSVIGGEIVQTDNDDDYLTPSQEEALPSDVYEIPDGAIRWYALENSDLVNFRREPTFEMLNQMDKYISYFLPSSIDGYISLTHTSQNTTRERENVRIGGYNFGIEYYNILSDKRGVSEIISAGLTESDIENVAIIEYEYNKPAASETTIAPGWHPSAVFWVHTTKGDYLMKDNYKRDDNRNIIHNWEVYTPDEYHWR
jgi:hypothetical protein